MRVVIEPTAALKLPQQPIDLVLHERRPMMACKNSVLALDLRAGKCVEYARLPDKIDVLTASRWGLVCGLRNGQIAIVRKGKVVQRWNTGRRRRIHGLSAARSTIVTSYDEQFETDVWRMPKASLVDTINYRVGQVYEVSLSPDAKRLAIGGNSAHVYVWDLASPKKPSRILRGISRCIYGLCWIDDDRLASVPFGRSVDIWKVKAGTKYACLRGQRSDGVQRFSISESQLAHYGDRIAAGGLDEVVRIYSLKSKQHLAVGKGHKGVVRGLVFLDARRIVSVGLDRRAFLWTCPP